MKFYKNGDTIDVIVPLKNNGAQTANNIEVAIVISAGISINSISLPIGSWNGTTKIWSVSQLAVGVPLQATLTLKIDDACSLPATISWSVTADENDPISKNSSKSVIIGEYSCCDISECLGGNYKGYDTPQDAYDDAELPENSLFYLTGNVPGTMKNIIMIKKTV